MADGYDQIEKLRSAGFSEEEISTYANDTVSSLSAAGFSEQEVRAYFGDPGVDDYQEVDQRITEASMTGEGQTNENFGFVDALEAGWQVSTAGLLVRGQLPDKVLPEHASMLQSIASKATTLAGDLPAMLVGLVGGGAAGSAAAGPGVGTAIGAGIGAFATPEWMRGALLDYYEKGGNHPNEFMGGLASSFISKRALKGGATGGVIGAATVATGGAVGVGARLVGAGGLTTATAVSASELAAMTTVGAALAGEMPTSRDFIENAILLGAFKGGAKLTGVSVNAAKGAEAWLKDNYRATGERPAEAVVRLQNDPAAVQEAVTYERGKTIYDDSGRALPKELQGIAQQVFSTETQTKALAELSRYQRELDAGGKPILRGSDEVLTEISRIQRQQTENSAPAILRAAEEVPTEIAVPTEKLSAAQKTALSAAKSVADMVRAVIRPKDKPGNPNLTPAERTIAERFGEEPKRGKDIDDFRYEYIDDLQYAKMAVRKASKETGEVLPKEQNPAELLRVAFGATGKADHFLKEGTFDPVTNKIVGKSLDAIFKPIKKTKELDRWQIYAVSRRALELQKQGIESGMDLVAAADVVRQWKGNTAFEQAFKEYQDYGRALIEYDVHAGTLTREAADAALERHKNYIPYQRVLEEAQSGTPGPRGLAVRNPVREIKGSERQIINPLETTVKNTYTAFQLGENNLALGRLIEYNARLPESARFLSKSKRVIRPTELAKTDAQLKKFMEDHGIDPAELDGITIFRSVSKTLAKDEFIFFNKGKPEIYKATDARLVKSLRALDKRNMNSLEKLFAAPAAAFRAGVTLAPEFWTRNLLRDNFGGFIINAFKVVPMYDMVKGFAAMYKPELRGKYQEWLRSGGANAAMLAVDRGLFERNYFKMEQEGTLPISRMWNVVKTPFHYMQIAGMAAENATRLGQYMRARKGGATTLEAAMRSRDISLDFFRMGANIRALNAMGAFLGPRINGIDRLAEAFQKNPKSTLMKAAGAVTLPTVLLWWANHDKKWYKELPAWEKDLFWHVEINDTVFRIPRPDLVGVLFGAIPERLLDSFADQNPHAWEGVGHSIIGEMNVAQAAVPVLARPIMEIGSNYNWFNERPLVSSSMEENQLPEYRYTPYTSSAAKTLAKIIPAFVPERYRTPIAVDHLIRSWSGTLGQYASGTADRLLEAAGVVPDPNRASRTLSDIPFIGAFVLRHPTANTAPIERFFERSKLQKEVIGSYNSLVLAGKEDEAAGLIEKYKYDIFKVDRIRQAMSNVYNLIHAINENPTMSPDEKRQLLDENYQALNAMAEAGNMMLDAAKEP